MNSIFTIWARRPLTWAALITWLCVTLVVHRAMPFGPAFRIEIADFAQPEDLTQIRFGSAIFAALASDTNVACTASEGISLNSPALPSAPIRLWDLNSRTKLMEAKSGWTYGHGCRNRDWLAIGSWVDVKTGNAETQFYHMPSGRKGPRITTHAYQFSNNGRFIVTAQQSDLRVVNLDTHEVRSLKHLNSEDKKDIGVDRSMVSDDGRFFVAYVGSSLVVYEISTGKRTAQFPFAIEEWLGEFDVSLAPDHQALAWNYDNDLFVGKVNGQEPRREIKAAQFVKWLSADRLLVGRRLDGKFHRLEVWDWNSLIATWNSPPFPGRSLASDAFEAGTTEPHIVLSEDKQRLVCARVFVAESEPFPLVRLLQEWLRLPKSTGAFVETTILDTSNLRPIDSWTIPCSAPPDSVNVQLRFNSDRSLLQFTDSTVLEHWSIPPRSWLKSAGWSTIISLALLAPVALWRLRRRRKRATITPIPPTTSATPPNEAGHATT